MTRDDREFLRSFNIDPEPSDIEVMEDIMSAPGYPPTQVFISHTMARAIMAEYGELTIETYMRFRGVKTL